jgi:hypothetical protein
MRKGEIVSVIPKTDARYHLLQYITCNLDYVETINNYNEKIYRYYFTNLYHYDERVKFNSDAIYVTMKEDKNKIKYSVWIGKQYPKTVVVCSKSQNYYIENPLEYNWVYTEYKYVRR